MTLEQKAQKVRAKLEQIKGGKITDFDKQPFQEIAKKAGVNKMALNRYFTLGTMSLKNLQSICDVIGLEIIIREKVEL